MWNRIDRIKKIREAAGGVTTVKWVRAHVEEEKEGRRDLPHRALTPRGWAGSERG